MTTPHRLDLHVHSDHSVDGRSSVAEIAGRLMARGLSGFALTDHNSVRGHTELAAWSAAHPGFLVIPGVEVSTCEGHLLAFGVTEAPPPHRPLLETAEWTVSHGGEAVLPHPFRRPHGAGRYATELGPVRAAEVVNAHTSGRANGTAQHWASARKLAWTGGSDAHSADELGGAWTSFSSAPGTVDDVLEALRRGAVEAGGSSLTWAGWVRWGWRAGLARLRRGLRPI